MTFKSLDYTLNKYQKLCQALQDKHTICTVYEYLSNRPKGNIAVLRHDVDYRYIVKKSLKMAELEYRMGIQSTYYFRYPYTFNPDIIQEIRSLGHEIGYHYEVLSKTNGDYQRAIILFQSELEKFRMICPINTICMHGRPLSKYNNRSLWDVFSYEKYGIIGEAYLSLERNKEDDFHYFTDTGRDWSGKHSLNDLLRTESGKNDFLNLATTDNLINWLIQGSRKNLYLTVHPERWSINIREWVFWALIDLSMNLGKVFIKAIKHKSQI
jgi:hypothetical protein